MLRLGLRLMKRRGRPEPQVEEIRRRMNAVIPFIPGPPRGTTQTRRLEIAGLRAVRVASNGAPPDRHVLHLHGGGYIYGSSLHYRDFLWRVSAAAAAQVLSFDYRLAPEHPFPAALEDAVAAYRWLIAQGAAASRIALIGDSAGGGLVFATMLKLRDEGLPLPAAAIAVSPWTDLSLSGASLTLNARADPMLNALHIPLFARHYLNGADPRHPYASPLWGDLAQLPPSLIQVGGDEILHDDAVRMAQRLRAAGSRVEIEVWPRMPHVWPLFARIVPEGRRAVERIGAFVQREMSAA
jgi:acetyl esterase/lipase